MLLYSGKRVPNGRRVEIFLAEKGLSVPMEWIDLVKMEHKSADFTALNPVQRVPILKLDDGSILAESIAICRYFESLHPTPVLFGSGAKGQALVEMWNRRLEMEFWMSVRAAFRHLHPMMAEMQVPQVPAWGEANKPEAAAFLHILDAHLQDNEFVCGQDFSVADITGFITLEFCKLARIAVPEELEHVKRWYAAILSRPSVSA